MVEIIYQKNNFIMQVRIKQSDSTKLGYIDTQIAVINHSYNFVNRSTAL